MNPVVVVEGEANLQIIQALLPPDLTGPTQFVSTYSRYGIPSKARTFLVVRRSPLAVVMSTQTTEKSGIQFLRDETETVLEEVAGKIPFKVILFAPDIDSIFFTHPAILNRVFGEGRAESSLHKALASLLKEHSRVTTLARFLQSHTREEVESLRSAPPLQELIAFLTSMISWQEPKTQREREAEYARSTVETP